MTRGNPRPGQQRMPDRSDEVERLAHKDKAATTKTSGEIKDVAADQLPSDARDAARKAGNGHDESAASSPAASRTPKRTPKRSPKAGR